MWRSTGIGAGENRMSEHTGHGLRMWRNTGVGAGDNKMSEHIWLDSCMWGSTEVRVGDNKMIRVHGTLLIDVQKHLGRSRRE